MRYRGAVAVFVVVAGAACGDIIVSPTDSATASSDGGVSSSSSSGSAPDIADSNASSSSGSIDGGPENDVSEPFPFLPTPTIVTDPPTDPSADAVQVTNVVQITLADTAPMATIYYTLDGSDPRIDGGTAYSAPFELTRSCTVQAFARAPGYADTEVASLLVTVDSDGTVLGAPQLNPPAETANDTLHVALSTTTALATICVTTDGVTTPRCNDVHGTCTNGSTAYSAPLAVTSDNTTIQAVTCAVEEVSSQVVAQTYHLQVAPVTASGTTTITLATVTPNATLHHTTDGSIATCQSPLTSTSFPVSAGTTVSAIGCRDGFAPSATASFTY